MPDRGLKPATTATREIAVGVGIARGINEQLFMRVHLEGSGVEARRTLAAQGKRRGLIAQEQKCTGARNYYYQDNQKPQKLLH
jgi:hypothetical protein